jgi:hypothetical protein
MVIEWMLSQNQSLLRLKYLVNSFERKNHKCINCVFV